MSRRLVLGCGSVGQRIVERLSRVADELVVITADAAVAETLREENVRARCGDPTDPAVLEGLETPRVVFAAADEPRANRLALEHASERFPQASFVAYLSEQSGESHRQALEAVADRLVDTREELVVEVLGRTAQPAAENAIALREHILDIDGKLAVVMHDNPDPDAIASAVALVDIAERVGVEADACYFGEISHQENRAMVNLLELELQPLETTTDISEYDAFALVDHSRPGVNDQLPEALHIDIVIDHHPPRGPVPATFYDLREDVGATSTVLTEYLDRFDLEISTQTATALLYGIRIDTKEFTRGVSSLDFRAAAILWPLVDNAILDQIEQPTVDGDVFDTVARAIKNRIKQGSVVVASAGTISDRDALPQAADKLLSLEGVDTTLVFGFRDDQVFISARSRASGIDLGETLRDAYDQIGSAGGHANMAGAQLEIGILGQTDDEAAADSIVSIVEEVITDRFFEAIRTRPGTPVDAYRQTSERLFGSVTDTESESEA